MNSENRRPIFNLHIDDSGTRNPDHRQPTSKSGDWFGLGGIILRAEDEERLRTLHRIFCYKWKITYPLHSVKIRHRSGDFAWLASLSQKKVRNFFHDLDNLVSSVPGYGMACVVDRPGYHNRYFEKYGRNRWSLCKTAFSVVCERAAKFAIKHDRRIRVFVEETDKKSDKKLEEYFRELRESGMPFADKSSSKYSPLCKDEMKFRLLELKFKNKTSPPIQLADIFLYPMCRGGYDSLYRPHELLQEREKFINSQLSELELDSIGIKYSCFD